jgi:hypothetical protein
MKTTLFILSIISFLWSVTAFARTTLTPSQPTGEKGDIVTIDVHFSSDSADIVGAQFTLEYDPAQMSVGEINGGDALDDHEVFDQQETGKISLSLLSMSNKAFSEGILASISFSLDADLTEDTSAFELLEDETILAKKTGEKEAYEAIQKINDLFLQYAAEGSAAKPSTSRSVTFKAEDDGSDTSYEWNFGDGTIKTGQEATHVYKTPDSYLITITASNFLGTKESKRRITINAPYWTLDATDLGNGWKSFDWFGSFYEGTNTPWIFHESLGWLYREGDTVDDTWFWSEKFEWGWTSDLIYPYFSRPSGHWLFYLSGSVNPTQFYDYGINSWTTGNEN